MRSLLWPDKESVPCETQKRGITECATELGAGIEAGGVAGNCVGWAQLCTGWGQGCVCGQGCTSNMLNMLVTLDVSKLSSWLKADAEPNIQPMSVTLDVSRLSGWLKADADSNM